LQGIFMQNFTVIFAHGRESGPWGVKIRALARVAENFGFRVVSRDDSDTRDPELRVSRLIEEAGSIQGPVILAGSSMGGYVTAVASQTVKPVGLFLMAPALNMPGYDNHDVEAKARELEVVHGWDDDVVPFEGVLNFSRAHNALLHLVPAQHALIEQVDWLVEVFALFLARCQQVDALPCQQRLLATI
jgi:pimeloyl-ACP methyl ester carboxylesterase